MEYLQIKNGEALQITTHGNVEWSANHFCPASALTPDEAVMFDVHPLTVTEAPSIDPLTQSVARDGCELVDGTWQYKWRIDALSAEQIAINLNAAKASKIEAIKAERDRRKFNGVKVGTKWIHTDTYSRTQWMAMVMMGASIPAIDWTTMDGTSVKTSQALAGQVFQGTAQLDAALFGCAKTLITQVEAAADPASVDITVGWPATFEAA
jgi:hypothetical protein